MEFTKALRAPAKLDLPGWPYLIDYDKLRTRFPPSVFVAVFGSALREPRWTSEKRKWLFWTFTSRRQRFAKDVDMLVVVENGARPSEVTDNLSVLCHAGDSYGFAWVQRETPAALHLVVAGIEELERALLSGDADARSILGSCKVIEGNVTEADRLIAMASS